jgi:PD-(D/E)XK nuclease superfamily
MRIKFNADWHSYWLNGKRCLGATTVAGYPDNRRALEMWMKRMVLAGGARDPKLMERAAAYIDDKSKLNELAEQALELAKANEARDTGSAIHRLTELIDTGGQLVETELAIRVRHAWGEALDEAGLEIIPEYVERIVVYPDLYIAGTFDRLVRHKDTGQLVVLDLKTGAKAVEYPHPIAIQLAIYAHAPLLAGPLLRDGSTEQFDPMPDVDKTIGLVVHMPSDGLVELVEIDIAKGWQAFNEVCLPIIGWRDTTGLARRTISAATWNPTPRLVAEDGTVETQAPPPVSPVPSTTLTAVQDGDPITPASARIQWVKAWIRAIAKNGGIDQLARRWPTGVATTKQGGWTDSDIDQIAALCADIDANEGAAFWSPDPTTPTPTSQQTKQGARSR